METDDTWHMKFDADGKFLINEESEVFEEMLAFSKAMADEVAKNKFELCVDNIADLHARGLHPSRMMAAFRAFTNPSGGIGDAYDRVDDLIYSACYYANKTFIFRDPQNRAYIQCTDPDIGTMLLRDPEISRYRVWSVMPPTLEAHGWPVLIEIHTSTVPWAKERLEELQLHPVVRA